MDHCLDVELHDAELERRGYKAKVNAIAAAQRDGKLYDGVSALDLFAIVLRMTPDPFPPPPIENRSTSGGQQLMSPPLETLTLAADLTITRMGYGAMQLAGPNVFGQPKDRVEAITVLREAADLGITHIDTADFFRPAVTNEIIKEALHPYATDLHIVTKVGARRGSSPRTSSKSSTPSAPRAKEKAGHHSHTRGPRSFVMIECEVPRAGCGFRRISW